MDNERKCLLKMTHDSLLVANTGQPFSRLGVISICASHRGTKGKAQPIDLYSEWIDSDLPKAIREKEIETYLWDENRLFDDYNQEREVSFDYGGRFLWELLQNADDAMCPVDTPTSDLIGIKGLGFKSVLEITNRPEIYSEPFHFYFSASDSHRLLHEKGINDPPPLTFRIPHDNQDIEDIIDLIDVYPTIIRLPYKDEIAQKKVERELKNLSLFFLLLSQYIKSVEVMWPDGRSRLWRIKRDSDGELGDGDIYVEVIEDGLVKDTLRFRRWAKIWSPEGVEKRHSVAICLPLSSTGEVQVWEETFPLYSFFPTEELLPFRALFHASFDLDQSRKHVRDPDNEDILGHLKMLLGRIVDDVPADISLKAFFPKDEPNKETIAYVLWECFESVLRQKEFVSCIGGKKVTPPKSRLWEYDLGNVLKTDEIKVAEKYLVEPKLLRDSDLRKALDHLGAEPLEKEVYLTLLRYCKNDNIHDCQKALKAFFVIIKELVKDFPYQKDEYYLNICRKIPCWLLADGSARSLSDQLPFLRKEPELSLPNWLPFDALDAGFLEYLNEMESKDNNGPPKIWNEILFGRLLNNTSEELLKHFLVPTIEAKKDKDWWELHGGEVLHLYKLWTKGLKFKDSPVSIWDDNNRERLGNSLFLPTDKGWIPSWQCYAGVSWGGSESFDTFFRDIKERGVLIEPNQWPVDIEENKDHWKNILCYAGVSWQNKLIRKSSSDHNGWEIRGYKGSWWIECPFQSLVQEKDWGSYLNSLNPPNFNKRTQFDWDTKIHEQWAIEFFPEALPESPMERLMSIQPIAKEAKESRMKFSFQKGGGWDGRNTGQLKSFASWQIEDFPWMPCKQSLLDNRQIIPIDKTYMPGKGIGGLLPEINIKVPDGQEGRDLATFLTQIFGVRETLPATGEIIWKEWIEKLPDSVQRDIEQAVAIRATRMLYRSFFDIHDEKPEWFDEISDIPCLKWNQEGKSEQLAFNSSSDIYWLDEPYLAEPNTRIELLRRFNIFVLEQEQGKKAAGWCEINPLSTIVHVKPNFYTEDQETTNIIKKRYDERYNSLKVVSGLANLPTPENLNILAVDNLRLRIIKEEKIISAPRARSWKENGLILLDRAKKWQALGLALAQKQTRKDLSSTFEILLGARDGAEVLQRLRDLGVPESAIEDLESDFQGAVTAIAKESGDRTTDEEIPTEDIDDLENQDVTQEIEPAQESSTSDAAVTEQKKSQIRETTHSGIVSQNRRKKGEDAENWVRSSMSDLLSISEWVVSSQPERDHLNRESDIVLSHPTLGKYHIEVKHVEAGEIFWSEREVSKAKDHKHKYWMVLVRPKYTENDQNIIWLWDPLEDLQNLPRHGKWIWRTEIDDSKIEITGWDVPTLRKKEDATHFTFVINVSNEFLDNFRPETSRGLVCFKEKLLSDV